MKFKVLNERKKTSNRDYYSRISGVEYSGLKTFNDADKLAKNDYILYIEHFSDTGDRTFIYQYKGYIEATGQYQVMRTDTGSFEYWNMFELRGIKLGALNMVYVHHNDFDMNLIKKEFPKWIGEK